MGRFANTLMLAATVAVVATQAFAGQHEKKMKKDIVDTAVSAGNFNTLAAALTEAELVGALKGEGPFTVFAPTDEAFANLPEGTVESLLEPENRDKLVAILTYHVVQGKLKAMDVLKMDGAETLNGQRLDISIKGEGVMIDKASVVKTDIAASNGVIHVIDTVLMPTTETIVGVANDAGSFKTLIAAVEAAGLADALMGAGPYTVFAPTDEAFSSLPEGTVESLLEEKNRAKLQLILKYHVVSGRVFSDTVVKKKGIETLAGYDVRISLKDGKAYANESMIVATDIDAANGVIHVIDGVLFPPEKRSSLERSAYFIEVAINQGAPMYNQGNAAGCAAMYEMCANAILSMHSDLPEETQAALRESLQKMRRAHSADEQAWIMRRGLDRAYESMQMEITRR